MDSRKTILGNHRQAGTSLMPVMMMANVTKVVIIHRKMSLFFPSPTSVWSLWIFCFVLTCAHFHLHVNPWIYMDEEEV